MGSKALVVDLGIRGCLHDLVALFVHLERNLNHQHTGLVLPKDLPPQEGSDVGT